MRVSKLPFATAVIALAVALGAAGDASAQALRWGTSAQTKKEMEKERKPGLFLFEVPNDQLNRPLQVCFNYPQVIREMKKFAMCRVPASGGGMAGVSWNDPALAKEYGVGMGSMLVFVSYDNVVMDTVSSPIDYNDLAIKLHALAEANKERASQSKSANTELDQVEKRIDEKKWQDATRRAIMVAGRSEKIDGKTLARASALLDKCKKECTSQIAAAKPLADDPAKKAEAKAALKQVISDFGKLDEAKEAQEMLNKLND